MSGWDSAGRWDQRYGSPEYFYGTAPNEFLREQITAFPAGGRVLCLGDGEGRNGVFLAEHGFEVVSLDLSSVGLAKAARLAHERGVALGLVHADLKDYVIAAGAWDGVTSIWCHLPRPLRQRVHREIVLGLRPGGALVYLAYTPAQLAFTSGGPREPELLPTLAELRSELAGLRLETAIERERQVQEGRAHRGLSAVVEIVARQIP
jgi:SAM-dependent methyltransferase